MRKIGVFALVFVLVAALSPVGRTDPQVLQIVRVAYETEDDARFLINNFDDTHNHSAREVELLLWPGDRARLDATGFDYRIVVEDLVAHDRALAKGPTPMVELPGPDRDDYRRLPDYNAEMKQLADENKSIVKMFEMKRQSLEGRSIFGLEIAAPVAGSDGRPVFYVDGIHHAREWPAGEYPLIFAHYLVEGFGKDPKVTSLLKKARVVIVPIVNVDGFDYSRENVIAMNRTVDENTELPLAAVNGFENYWRKNRRSFTGVTVPAVQKNPDAYGVDPNRNYSYLWGDSNGGSSDVLLDATYRGAAPFSEPETQNVRDIVLSRGITGIITNHTVQATVLRAGGGQSPEDVALSTIGERMAEATGYANRPTVGYPTTGTTDDWAYAVIGAFGYTIEHGGAGFHSAYATTVGELTDGVMKAFMIMGDVAVDPKYHSVLTGKVSSGAAKLTLMKTFETPLSPGNPTGEESFTDEIKISISTAKDGSFEWHVGPSTSPWEKPRSDSYTLVIKAGGKTKKIPVTVSRGQRLNLGTIKL